MGPLHFDPPRVGAMRRRTDPESVNATDPAACREAALKLLERTRRTRSDLARRLKDKGYASATPPPPPPGGGPALSRLEPPRRTRSDLARRLKDKGYAAATIAEVIGRLA